MAESEALEEPAEEADDPKVARPDTFAAAKDRLTLKERFILGFVRRTFDWAWLDQTMLWFQRVPGVFWVHNCTRHIRLEVGLERLGPLDSKEGVILACNHRSFFDMFVVNMVLYRGGFKQRLLFPVRSNFFYDSLLGLFVNGIMSWFSMYPPIFRDRKRTQLNHTSFCELRNAMLAGRSAGVHPEGRRNKEGTPYELLPAQPGVGRLIHHAHSKVIPVFINGLGNHLPKQIWGNFNKKGPKIIVVFGPPVDYGDLLSQPPNARTFRAIADRTRDAISLLGEEERKLRPSLEAQTPPHSGGSPGS